MNVPARWQSAITSSAMWRRMDGRPGTAWSAVSERTNARSRADDGLVIAQA
jgi:hypothetical protein